MTFTYSITEGDYLQLFLYTASKSKAIKAARRRNWIITPVLFFLIAIYFYNNPKQYLFWYFLAAGVLSAFFFPIYHRMRYKKHYLKYIRDNYKNIINEPSTLNITQDLILYSGKAGESKVNLSAIEEIAETGEYYFIILNNGTGVIIPKAAVPDKAELQRELQGIVASHNIKYTTDLDWKWK